MSDDLVIRTMIRKDVTEPNGAAGELAERHGLEKVFVTVRMYTGAEPAMDKDKIFGVTSFELG